MPHATTTLPLYLEPQDVEQEMAILRWQGIRPKRAFVEHKLSGLSRREVPFCLLAWEGRDGDSQDFEPSRAMQMPWSEPSPRSPQAIEALVRWASSQSSIVQKTIQSFLEDPDAAGALENALAMLKRAKVLAGQRSPAVMPSTPGTPGTLTALIYRHLPATKDQLVQIIRQESLNTQRPEATVRQFIRRATSEGKVVVVGDQIQLLHGSQ